MNTPDKLDCLLKDALSPERESVPAAVMLERTRLLLMRGRAYEDLRVERKLALSGLMIALAEILALLLFLAVAPPSTLLGAASYGIGFFQAVCLFACALGSRFAIKHLTLTDLEEYACQTFK